MSYMCVLLAVWCDALSSKATGLFVILAGWLAHESYLMRAVYAVTPVARLFVE